MHRLYVARKGDADELLVAEADVEVERTSLATLLRTIRSDRWHARSAPVQTPALSASEPRVASAERSRKGKRAKRQEREARPIDPHVAIVCPTCGAIAAPSADASVTCRFCNGPVPIPDDVRERVKAAAALASARRSGMTRLERLLATQPSARFARVTMAAAAVPIAIAWPLAGALVVHNVTLGMVTPGRVAAVALLPLLVIAASFLLARGRLTDRFALHAVVIGFGAREPPRPGEPYRCRSCGANLPVVSATPVVYCVYCDKPNVLGLDLSGEAEEASEEQRHLETAFASREAERVRWRIAGVAALAMIVASTVVVRRTFADIARVSFEPLEYSANVISVDPPSSHDSAMPPVDGDGSPVTWSARVEPVSGKGVNCHVRLVATAGHERSFTYDHEGRCTFAGGVPVRYSDAWTQSNDNDPKVEIDLAKKRAVLRGDDRDDDGAWKVTLQLRDTP